jgi:hypothetical protein
MAKSYAQVNGHQVVDWKKELQLVIDGKEPRIDFDLASKWETCYVGQQSEMIERENDGEPEDETLEKLGMGFTNNVGVDNSEALHFCELIDVRVAYLLEKEKQRMLAKIATKEAEIKELKAELKKF